MTFTLAHRTTDQAQRLSYYRQALGVCLYVQRHVFDATGRIVVSLRPAEVQRLQRAVFTSGTIYFTLGPTNVERALQEYTRSLELVLRPPPPCPDPEQYSLRDLLVAACIAGHAMSTGSTRGRLPDLSAVLCSDSGTRSDGLARHLLGRVRASGDQLLHALLATGGGILPTPLLVPDQVSRLWATLFGPSNGVLPSICMRGASGELEPPTASVQQSTNSMTSTILLTLAKRLQDDALGSVVLPGSTGGLRASTSVVILLYYVALALSPAPSTYNNLGIVLSGVSESRSTPEGDVIDGTSLARMFYSEGLRLDPKHPHLLTNLGSLLKDQGQTDEAIK